MKIFKFGGSSLATGKRILYVAEIIKKFSLKGETVIVVSAMEKITDKLISIFEKYKANQMDEAFKDIRIIYKIHAQALNELNLSKAYYKKISNTLFNLFGNLSIYLTLNKDYLPDDYDYIISFGERFSCCLLAAALNKINISSTAIDSSEVIIANNVSGNAKADIKKTIIQANKILLPFLVKKIIPVVTGFFALSKEGRIVTFGRGGSDYSATILANALNAQEVILWKEVDGVFNCDPKNNNHAKFYPLLSYKNALKLSKNGARILHPEAIKPAAEKEIIVWVKNTFNPNFTGTRIWR